MRSANITRRQADALFDVTPTDEDITAVQEDAALSSERAELPESDLPTRRGFVDAFAPRPSRRVRPTSALLDGTARERRERREARRAINAIVRAIPAVLPVQDATDTDRRAA